MQDNTKVKNVGRINLARKFLKTLLRVIPMGAVRFLKLTLKICEFLDQYWLKSEKHTDTDFLHRTICNVFLGFTKLGCCSL